jgi:predicted TIM-barrel fold metal-dependent hydrolase
VPTPHALELAASLQEALDLIDSALRASRGFDPQAAERTAIENDGIDRILFASDFPFYDMAEVRKQVEDAVGREAAQRIYANRVPGLRLPTPAVSA